jgi:hypothetical protein
MVGEVERFARDEKLSFGYKVLTLGGASAAVLGSFSYGISSGLSALCFGVAKLGGVLTENRHSRAQGVLVGSLLSLHFRTSGLDAMANNAEVYAGRMLVQSMIPESRWLMSTVVASVGVALSWYLFCSSPGFMPVIEWENVPLVVTVLSGAGGALPDRYSWASRISGLTSSVLMFAFHTTITGSWFLAALSAVFAYETARNILTQDIPRMRGRAESKESGPSSPEA